MIRVPFSMTPKLRSLSSKPETLNAPKLYRSMARVIHEGFWQPGGGSPYAVA